jgi:hypothetical protein
MIYFEPSEGMTLESFSSRNESRGIDARDDLAGIADGDGIEVGNPFAECDLRRESRQ